MKRRYTGPVLAALVLGFVMGLTGSRLNARAATTSTDNRDGSEALIIERAIVSNQLYNNLLAATLSAGTQMRLENNVVYNRQPEDINALLALFDYMHSSESDRELANLGSYYFGESAGELYECVVLRKGRRMIPYLRGEIVSSDCEQTVGRRHPGLCLDSKARRLSLRLILKELVAGKRCPATDPSIDYALHARLP